MSFAQKRKFDYDNSESFDSRKFQRNNENDDSNRNELPLKNSNKSSSTAKFSSSYSPHLSSSHSNSNEESTTKSKKDFEDYEKQPYESVLQHLPDDYNADKEQATKVLKNAQRTRNLRHFNRLIGDLGNTRNMYSYAIRAYQGLLECKLEPNSYTYTALINAAARAADLKQGQEWFQKCHEHLGESSIDQVMMTAMIKLCCNSGDLKQAMVYFKELYHHKTLSPSIRTYNTIIRQCFMDNAIEEAVEIYGLLEKQIEAQQGGKKSESKDDKKPAKKTLQKGRTNFDSDSSDSNSDSNSDSDSDSDDDSESSSKFKKSNQDDEKDETEETDQVNDKAENSETVIISTSILEFMTRLYALNFEIPTAMQYFDQLGQLYNDRTSREARYDATLIPYTYISAGIAITQACIALNDLKTGRRIFLQCKDVLDKISKSDRPEWKSTYVHPNQRQDKNEKVKDKDEEANHRVAFEHDSDFTKQQFLTQRANESKNALFDIDKYLTATALAQNVSIQTLQKNEKIANLPWRPVASVTKTNGLTFHHRVLRIDQYQKAMESKDKTFLSKFESDVLNDKKKIDFVKIFRNKNPLVMEIGSGTGEWLINKAIANPELNFIAAEIMPTRVYDIYSRMLLNNVKNVVILQGDAILSMDQLIGTKSMHQLFVNFPEPPWWSQWRYKLFTPAFFAACHQSLVKSKVVVDDQDQTDDRSGLNGQGTLTIVTDDSFLTYQLHRTIFHENGDVYNLFLSFLADEVGKSVCFKTQLPFSYGSSYYHRFWKRGAKFRRFYIKMGKNNNISNAVEHCNEIQKTKKSKVVQRPMKKEQPQQGNKKFNHNKNKNGQNHHGKGGYRGKNKTD